MPLNTCNENYNHIANKYIVSATSNNYLTSVYRSLKGFKFTYLYLR